MTTSEQIESRTGSARSGIELVWNVWHHEDSQTAQNEVIANAPSTYRGLIPDWLASRVEPLVSGVWRVSVPYKALESQEPPETNDNVFSFEIAGSTQKITQSLETVNRYARPTKTAPNFRGAIGVTKDSVEGTDIFIPSYTWNETVYQPWNVVNETYRKMVFSICGTTNNAGFRGFEAGEVLFLGASGTIRQSEVDWEVNYRFVASPNITGLTIGDIEGIEKKGHEYLWVRFEDEEDDDAKTLVKVPSSVHIERVYEPGNYSDLQI